MSHLHERLAAMSPQRLALLAMELQERVESLERSRSEPIAVVGMACRFPGGASDPEAFWRLLEEGRDAVTETPAERWDVDELYDPDPDAPGKIATRWGAYLEGIDRFDADFFGISPREAVHMDPQQRLFLEVAWEAIEDAGRTRPSLAGSATAVFAGVSIAEYPHLERPERLDAYTSTGGAFTIVANRVSYLLDLRGPSLAVDTACSSSLVAIHLACQSLRTGESDLALAGGVNLMLAPETTICLSKARMMAPDGRSKPFDSRADGYVRGEGCGVVVLKRLADARRDRDRVLAVVRGTAVNQDGLSNGLTAPNELSQEDVYRRALRLAGVEPAAVTSIEAHGTGTSLGDPIEVESIQAVYGAKDAPRCALGSVKSQIGHLEAAAGIAGFMKTVLALRHRTIPPTIHLARLNPAIALEGSRFFIPTRPAPWPGEGPRLAAVSSFGFGGTNAHAVLEEAPAEEPPAAASGEGPRLFVLSARSPEALRALAEAHRSRLDRAGLGDACYTAARRRTHHEHRLALVARSHDELASGLAAFLAGSLMPGASAGRTSPIGAPRIAFAFSGQGSQWPGMASDLLERAPAFRAAIEECDRELRPLAGWSLLDLVAGNDAGRLERTEFAQPAIFVVEVALARQLAAWGLVPSAVVGHSVGEVAAAHVAGALRLADAVRVAFHRGRAMELSGALGAMAAIGLSAPDLELELAGRAGLTVAARNAPSSVVVAGDPGEVEELVRRLSARGVFAKRLPVGYAFHTPRLEAARPELERALAGISASRPAIPFHSTVTGRISAEGDFGPAYWGRGIVEPVRFAEAAASMAGDCDLVLELGPHPVLGGALAETLAVPVSGTLRRGEEGYAALLGAAGFAHVHGALVDWKSLFPEGRLVPFPAYPWQKKRHWVEGSRRAGVASAYYDALAGTTTELEAETGYLTFGPLPEIVPGFSWILALARPEERPDHARIFRKCQAELREALLGRLDVSGCRRVLDFGCGYGADLVELARRHPGLVLDGYTISARQAAIGREKAAAAGVAGRVAIHQSDSASDEFPARYDLVFGFEVAHHVPDKRALFANVGRHLEEGGRLVLADFVSNGPSAIEHQETSSWFPTAAEWVEHLSSNGLVLDEAVDASREIANFLHDPEFDANLARLSGPGADENVRNAFRSYDRLGKLLARRLASYVLLRARKDSSTLPEARVRANRERLASLVAYERIQPRRWLYRLDWRPAPREATGPAKKDWLVAGGGGLGEALGRRLAGGAGPREVAFLGALDAEPSPEGLEALAAAILDLVRRGDRLHLVTRGALSTNPFQAPLLGLGRVLSLERSTLWGGLVDLDPEVPVVVDSLARELESAGGEDLVALSGTERGVARLARFEPAGRPLTFRPDATYLVTGGSGGIGLEIASWLARKGARTIALLSRRGPPEVARSRVEALKASGVEVLSLEADVADRESLAAALALAGPLAGVFHAAGVVEDAPLVSEEPARLGRVFAPKVRGAWNLHELAPGVEHFVLFSSAASWLGSPGQGSYAAANAFLDGLARWRRARGLPGLSIAWGPWSGAGMAVRSGALLRMAARGVGPIDPAAGTRILEALLGGEEPDALVLPADWNAYRRAWPGGSLPRFLSAFERELPAAEAADIRDRLAAAAPEARGPLFEEYLAGQVARVLRVAPGDLDLERPVTLLGLDSLMALELRNRLEVDLGVVLPVADLLQGPSTRQIAARLAPRLALDAEGTLERLGEMSEAELDRLLGDLTGSAAPESS